VIDAAPRGGSVRHVMNLASIPSPTTSVWHLGAFPIRAYALCIVLGIVVAVLVMEYRLRARGVAPWASLDMAVWAVPFGIVGARIYHLITSPQEYFGAGGHPMQAFKIWEGGLGIWGAVAGGALGAWFAARQLGLPLSVFADALAPALPLAQAVGRFGNWFNNELYGKITTLPWGLQVHNMDPENPGHSVMIDGKAQTLPDLYQPTFLYEAIWDVGTALLVFALDRKFKFGKGRAFALYVMAYTAGRCWIEMLRIDDANHIFGIRLNVFTAIIVFIGGLIYFLVVKGPREYVVPIDAAETEALPAAASDISQVDVSAGGEPIKPKAPRAYQVVSYERFETYERTGVLPPAAEPARTEPAAEKPEPEPAADPFTEKLDPVAGEPVAGQSAAVQPEAAFEKPVAEKPVAEKPAAEEPVAAKPGESEEPDVAKAGDSEGASASTSSSADEH
jgi:prolipoprotein diacylglyceryl transferase